MTNLYHVIVTGQPDHWGQCHIIAETEEEAEKSAIDRYKANRYGAQNVVLKAEARYIRNLDNDPWMKP